MGKPSLKVNNPREVMVMARKKSGIWLAVLLLALGLAALACGFGTDQDEGEPAEVPQADVEADPEQPAGVTPSDSTEGHVLSLPAVMFSMPGEGSAARSEGEGMPVVPAGWYYADVEQEGLTGVLFSMQSPEELAAFDDPTQAVPLDFAGGAFVRTDLPTGADPQEMLAGMESSLAELGDPELGAMLITADQTGLLNLQAVDVTRLERAWVGELGGKPAIVMEGTAHFLDGKPPVLRVQVWLAWTPDAFYTLYLLASETVWQETSPAFEAVEGSINLP
jgi:hypothetical protein